MYKCIDGQVYDSELCTYIRIYEYIRLYLCVGMYVNWGGGVLPNNNIPRPSPVTPSRPKMPRNAALAALEPAEAVPPTTEKAERARRTSACAVRPVMAMSSLACAKPPAQAHCSVRNYTPMVSCASRRTIATHTTI